MVATTVGPEAHVEQVRRSLDDLAYAATVCRGAGRALATTPAADVVTALAGIHERDLAHLRRLGARLGVEGPDAGSAEETEALGRLRAAQSAESEAAVLAIVHEAEARATGAYERVRDDPALPGEFRTLAASALEELSRRHQRLEAAARVAD